MGWANGLLATGGMHGVRMEPPCICWYTVPWNSKKLCITLRQRAGIRAPPQTSKSVVLATSWEPNPGAVAGGARERRGADAAWAGPKRLLAQTV